MMCSQNRLQSLLLACCSVVTIFAQSSDSLKVINLQEVSIVGVSSPKSSLSVQSSVYVSPSEIRRRSGHSLMDMLAQTEGVQAMDIGVGFSKPMIRGLGFQRIVVTENGVKQEGQQWGADHGLEIDAFHVDGVRVVKGPASVLYGSDAIGGAIEILPPAFPPLDTLSGEAVVSFRSVCAGLSGSLMLQKKRNRVFTKIRYTERHWADYRVPSDSFTYLSMRLPIFNNRLKNTAGMERSFNALLAYKGKGFLGRIGVSDSYQKSGFFSGAHGLPNSANLQDDANRWNVDLPRSLVNHLKVVSSNVWTRDMLQAKFILAYQANHREEWSRFHSHNLLQTPPAVDPDKELSLGLRTGSALLQFRLIPDSSWELYGGLSAMAQRNRIGGYGFLIPAYKRQDCGAYLLANYRRSSLLQFSASARYDLGHIQSDGHADVVQSLDRCFRDYSLALGVEFRPVYGHLLKASMGRAFRLPSVNELTSNGVHHGAFRHEMGDSGLVGENGWQADLSYAYCNRNWDVSLSPFFCYYPHFVVLAPTGQWSMLPDAGQIYKYVDVPTTLAGCEAHVKVLIWRELHYSVAAEYVHTQNRRSHTATPFSPPASVSNALSWEHSNWRCSVECQSVAPQRRVCHNESPTPGYNLVHLAGGVDWSLNKRTLSLLLHVRNLFDTPYLNHLNFYRRIELPEAGIDVQTTIRLSF